jgi:hypothetical protein
MPSKEEQMKHDVKQYQLDPVMNTQWRMTWNNANYAMLLWTGEEWSETIQTMPSKDYTLKHAAKKYKPRTVMMSQ